jgi:hypothetical protein
MSSDLSPYFGNKICRWLNNQADMPSRPTNLYIALFNGNPKTSGTEVGATINSGAPRQEVTFADIASGASHLLTSDIAVDFGNAEGAATFTHVALYDNATPGSGNLYASKVVSGGTVSVLVNSSVKFQSGGITFNIGSDT